MKPDQERVKSLLSDTVTLLCKNGLQFNKELRVQGLLGITLDDSDVFVVHINETFGGSGGDTPEETTESVDNDLSNTSISENRQSGRSSPDSSKPRHRKSRPRYDSGSASPHNVKSRHSDILAIDDNPPIHIKKESMSNDDVMVIESKSTNFHQPDLQHVHDNYGSSSDGSMLGFGQGYSDDLGPPTAKRKASDSFSGNVNSGAYIKSTHPSTMDMSGMGQMGDDGGMMLDGSSAQWDPSQGTSQSYGQHTDSNNQDSDRDLRNDEFDDHPTLNSMYHMTAPMGRGKKIPRPFACSVEGCNRQFARKGDLYRHHRINHGAGHVNPDLAKAKQLHKELRAAAKFTQPSHNKQQATVPMEYDPDILVELDPNS